MKTLHPCRTLCGAAAIALAAACSRTTEPAPPAATPTKALTALPRPLSAAEQSIIGASNAFSSALFSKVVAAQPDSNVFLSPLSVSMSLGMTLNGAANTTYDQMRSALQFGTLSQHDIDAGYKSLLDLLVSLDPAVQTKVANAIWYRRGFPVYQTFLDSTKTYFDAQVQGLDFTDVAGSLATINGWVSQQTNGKIPSILDGISSDDVMFLVNAIYFNGTWRAKFDTADTKSATFHAADGSQQPMQLMHRNGPMRYVSDSAYQAVELPYGDSAFTMTVLLPAPGVSVDSIAKSLTASFWGALSARMRQPTMDLYLPKLKLSWARQLNEDLKALGMQVPFVPNVADFTRMSSMGNSMFIAFVRQKSYVDVNEAGTEAAAVTVTGIQVTSYEPPVVMRVDRPYLFVIRERLSGTILFMGRIVTMPSVSSATGSAIPS